MTEINKGGRGKKAPYKTVHYRIPEPLKITIQLLANKYKNLIGTKYCDELIINLEELISITGCISENEKKLSKAGTKYVQLKEKVLEWQKNIEESAPGFKEKGAVKLIHEIKNLKLDETDLLQAFEIES